MRSCLIILTVFLAALGLRAQTSTADAPKPTGAATITLPAAAPVPGTSVVLNGYLKDASYKLRAGDVVSFQIMEDQVWDPGDLPKNLIISDSGALDVPYVGRVLAADKTCTDLAREIKAALEKDYYQHATVIISLNVANHVFGRVYLWGQVRNQGPIELQLNENLTAGQAILRAGGFADFANKAKVKVIRGSPGTGTEKKTFDLDMVQILEKGKTENDILLQPGDYIIVPSRLVNF